VPYLANANAFMQARHLRTLEGQLSEASKLAPEMGDQERAASLVACLEGTTAVVRQSAERLLSAGSGA
jgi:hypothetical protein